MNGHHLHTKMARVSYYKGRGGEGGGEGEGGSLEGVGWVGGSVRFNPRRTMRDQGGREGNASDDALLKT